VLYPSEAVPQSLFLSRRSARPVVAALAVSLLLVGCDGSPSREEIPGRAEDQAPADPSSGGNADGTCVNGWRTPPAGSRLYRKPLEVIRRTMEMQGRFIVDEMRYFEGPESPPSNKGYLLTVRRWYVKARLATDPSFRARWLVEAREFGAGLAAVAPYDSRGFRSPDWVGFQYETAGRSARPRPYPGLPGLWKGAPYNFVRGEPEVDVPPGESLGIPGLPSDVAGCLAAT
jgi:hypothetical protein